VLVLDLIHVNELFGRLTQSSSSTMAGGLLWNPVTRYIATRLNGLTSYVPPPPKEDGAAPRRILLVDAHPCEESFSAAIANAVVDGAKQGGEGRACT
jgi:hypothetical protein